jgi:5-methylcytosine-specific restriction endonuclease McrA
MRTQSARSLADEELIQELRRVADVVKTDSPTMAQFSRASERVNAAVVKRRFGSWKVALERAGLKLSPHGRRYSNDEYFDNILTVWTHYGRQPKYREMNTAPSAIPAGAYEAKFGGWRSALGSFVERVNADREFHSRCDAPAQEPKTMPAPDQTSRPRTRAIPIGLRYDVLRRDKFKCVLCGANPAVTPTCQLHVDHIVPFARGGATDEQNLRTLCSHCNVGKRDKTE